MNAMIILNYNDSDNCISLVSAVKNFGCIDRIIVVDNCSTDGSYEKLLPYADEKTDVVQTDKNGGYSYGNNYGVRIAVDRYYADKLVLSNTDVIVDEETLSASLNAIGKDNIAYCAPLMQYSYKSEPEPMSKRSKNWFSMLMNKTITGTLIRKARKPKAHPEGLHKIEIMFGALFCITAESFSEVGMFDEHMFLYFEEETLFYKLNKKGYETIADGDHKYIHAHGASINKSIKGKYRKFVEGAKSEKYFWFNIVKINAFSKLIYNILASIIRFERFVGYTLTGR